MPYLKLVNKIGFFSITKDNVDWCVLLVIIFIIVLIIMA